MSPATLSLTPLALQARTAADLMTPNPTSLQEDVTLHEAVAWLVDRGVSGAPVIDEAGRPVGVFSRTDVLIHDREETQHLAVPEVDYGTPLPRKWWEGFQLERVDTTRVRDLMTPAVFCVKEDASAWSVIEQLRELNVHRLFVVDDNGVLVGVITALDVVRHLAPA
jgi:CBS domain-containing protein